MRPPYALCAVVNKCGGEKERPPTRWREGARFLLCSFSVRRDHQSADIKGKPSYGRSPCTDDRGTGAMCITRLMTKKARTGANAKWSKQRIYKQMLIGHLTALSLREQKVFKMNAIGERTRYT